tara:strand:+ start:40265 stop:40771 length:507 start_codon:yes stop_codon:yes gene_type:complete
LHNTALVLFGSLLLAISAKISLPLQPTPVTLQTFAVLLLSMLFGSRLGVLTVLAYLAEGFMGMPVFAEPVTGFAVFLSPTIGYLLGFIPAAFVAGLLVERGWGMSRLSAGLAAFIGATIILFCGWLGLAVVSGPQMAFTLGVVPFVGIELAKVLVLAATIPFCWKSAK